MIRSGEKEGLKLVEGRAIMEEGDDVPFFWLYVINAESSRYFITVRDKKMQLYPQCSVGD